MNRAQVTSPPNQGLLLMHRGPWPGVCIPSKLIHRSPSVAVLEDGGLWEVIRVGWGPRGWGPMMELVSLQEEEEMPKRSPSLSPVWGNSEQVATCTQEASSGQETNIAASRPWTCSFLKCENECLLLKSPSVCGIFLQQQELTKTIGRYFCSTPSNNKNNRKQWLNQIRFIFLT